MSDVANIPLSGRGCHARQGMLAWTAASLAPPVTLTPPGSLSDTPLWLRQRGSRMVPPLQRHPVLIPLPVTLFGDMDKASQVASGRQAADQLTFGGIGPDGPVQSQRPDTGERGAKKSPPERWQHEADPAGHCDSEDGERGRDPRDPGATRSWERPGQGSLAPPGGNSEGFSLDGGEQMPEAAPGRTRE